MLLESNSGNKLLIDCGTDIRHSLHAQGYSQVDINAVYISHLHSDHTGGLEWLGFASRFIDVEKPDLYISSTLTKRLWDNVLCGGMSSIESEKATLASFFYIHEIKKGFSWEEYDFELVKTIHYYSNREVMPSYGLLINNGYKTIFITTDTRFYPELEEIFNKAELIFHDCETDINSGQHARYQELKTLKPEIKKKIWLYDYNNDDLPDAKSDGFLGFIKAGQSFKF